MQCARMQAAARPSAARPAMASQAARSTLGPRPATRRPAAPAAGVPAAHTAALALSLALAPLTPLAASADDADPAAAVEQVAAAVASSGGVFGLTPVGAGLAALPIISYSLFFVYREKINPRATIVDLLFGVAATVILGNIFSILVFKTRIY